jgi:hypothetical protein
VIEAEALVAVDETVEAEEAVGWKEHQIFNLGVGYRNKGVEAETRC